MLCSILHQAEQTVIAGCLHFSCSLLYSGIVLNVVGIVTQIVPVPRRRDRMTLRTDGWSLEENWTLFAGMYDNWSATWVPRLCFVLALFFNYWPRSLKLDWKLNFFCSSSQPWIIMVTYSLLASQVRSVIFRCWCTEFVNNEVWNDQEVDYNVLKCLQCVEVFTMC